MVVPQATLVLLKVPPGLTPQFLLEVSPYTQPVVLVGACRLVSTSPDKIRNAQKLDTIADRKFPNDRDSASVFSKVIGRKLSHGSRNDLYLRCWMNFLSNIFQIEAPQLVHLGLLDVNTLNEFGILGTPATRVRRPIYGSHWSALDHIFGRATVVRMSAARSDQDYSYKTYLKFRGKIRTLGTKIF